MKSSVRSSDIFRAVWLAAGLVLGALIVSQLATLVLLGIIGVILALPLAAAADRAERAGLPRIVGAIFALLLLTALAVGLGFALVPPFIREIKDFTNSLPSILDGAQRSLRSLGVHSSTKLSAKLQTWLQGYVAHPDRLLGPLTSAGVTLLTVAAGIVVVAICAFALALRPDPAVQFALRLVPLEHRAQIKEVMSRVREAWLGWMVAVGLDMLVLGSLLWLGMFIIGLPFAIGFAVFSALMTVIPNYGSVISAVPPIAAGLAHSTTEGILVLVVYLIVNQIEGNLILPLIMARRVDMHPAVVAIGLLVVAALFGLIGVFVAIPLISLVIIVVQVTWVEPQEVAYGLVPLVPSDTPPPAPTKPA